MSSLVLGGMMFGTWGSTSDDDCSRIVAAAIDHGINFIDTADIYSRGESETIIGKALQGRRDEVVLATKFHNPMGKGVNRRGNSRYWIRRAVDESLGRLQTDHIDLYQAHRPDPATDLEETIGALDDLVRQGKIGMYGTSTYPAHEVVRAQHLAREAGAYAPSCEQPPYSLLTRRIEGDLLPVCRRYRLGVIVWGPLDGGWLTGRHRLESGLGNTWRAQLLPRRFDQSDALNAKKLEIVDRFATLADESGIPLPHLAVAFTINHPAVTAAIVGPRTVEQLLDILAAAELSLPTDVLDAIDEIVPPGQSVDARDDGWVPPELDPSQRRRPPAAAPA